MTLIIILLAIIIPLGFWRYHLSVQRIKLVTEFIHYEGLRKIERNNSMMYWINLIRSICYAILVGWLIIFLIYNRANTKKLHDFQKVKSELNMTYWSMPQVHEAYEANNQLHYLKDLRKSKYFRIFAPDEVDNETYIKSMW